MRARLLAFAAVLVALMSAASGASAHGMRSIYVEIVEGAPGLAHMTLRA